MSGKLIVEVVSASVGKEGSKLWDKLESASIKVELRDGNELQKGKTNQVSRKKDADGGFSLTYNTALDFEVNEKLSGELRVMLCRAKNSSMAGGTKPIANAGIYVEKIVGFIKDKKKQISKSFTLYAVEGGGNGGIVTLKLNFIPTGATAPLGAPVVAAAPAGAVDLGEHQAAAVDTANDHVTTVKAHGTGPPIALIGGVLLLVAGAAAVLLGGGGAAAAPVPAGKGGKAPAKGKAAPPAKGKAVPAKGKK